MAAWMARGPCPVKPGRDGLDYFGMRFWRPGALDRGSKVVLGFRGRPACFGKAPIKYPTP